MDLEYSVIEYWNSQQAICTAIRLPGKRKRRGIKQCRILTITLEVKFIPVQSIKRTLEDYSLKIALKHYTKMVKEHSKAGLPTVRAMAALQKLQANIKGK